jgi:hypothetical protein
MHLDPANVSDGTHQNMTRVQDLSIDSRHALGEARGARARSSSLIGSYSPVQHQQSIVPS